MGKTPELRGTSRSWPVVIELRPTGQTIHINAGRYTT